VRFKPAPFTLPHIGRDPEEVLARCEQCRAPTNAEREQARTKVSSRVNGVARIHAKYHTLAHNHQSEGQGIAVLAGRAFFLVRGGVDCKNHSSCTDEFCVEGRVEVEDVVSRIRGEAVMNIRMDIGVSSWLDDRCVKSSQEQEQELSHCMHCNRLGGKKSGAFLRSSQDESRARPTTTTPRAASTSLQLPEAFQLLTRE
jgi:hypothetical protein